MRSADKLTSVWLSIDDRMTPELPTNKVRDWKALVAGVLWMGFLFCVGIIPSQHTRGKVLGRRRYPGKVS